MKKHTMIGAAILMFSISACYFDNEEELYPTSTSNCDTTNLTYSSSIKTIIDTRCATTGCHVSGSQSPDFSTYQGVNQNSDRLKVRAIDERSMPAAGPLSACEIQKLTIWINAGKPQ